MSVTLDDQELQRIYTWVDEIPLSRPKRNITRDFSDGVLLAEILHHYYPKLVEIHNYSGANSVRQKMYNWATLNNKVFRRLHFYSDKTEMDAIVNCKPGAIELLLMRLQKHIADMRKNGFSPSASGVNPNSNVPALMDNDNNSTTNNNTNIPNIMNSINAAANPSSNATRTAPSGTASAVDAVDTAMIAEKDATIGDLRETIEILELKIKKLEQLVRLKDSRIQTLTARLGAVAPSSGSQ